MVKYPTSLDTDAELPRVDDNITEIGGEAINSLRAAVFAIEKALGIKPQGTAADLAARLGVSLDNNGYIKASALSGIGLVTLPIDNAQVGSAAGIEESKLDLDYGTALLKSWIDSLRVRVDALEIAVAADIAHLAAHVASPSAWGRHTTGDIDAYGVFSGMTAQGALTDLDTRLNAHVADPVDAHDGSAISLDAGRFTTITATDVQTAAEQLEDLQLVEIVRHRDRQHGNGILGTQDAFVSGTSHGVEIIAASSTSSAAIGDTFIKFQTAPPSSAFESIVRNDRIDLTVGGKTYTFVVDGTEPGSTTQVNIFGSLSVSGIGTATVYRNAEEISEPSVGMVCLRREAIGTLPYDSTSRPATLQVVHPTAPYILSSGFKGSELSASASNIRLVYPRGNTYDMDVYTAMSSFFSWKSTWTAENVAKVMNAALLSPGTGGSRQHPIVAFAHKGELGFAYDLPDADGYLTIGTVGSNDATATLGFVQGATAFATAPRSLYIDGYEIPSIRLLFDAYGQVTSSDTITFPSVNPAAEGVQAGHLAKVSVWASGTYVISDASTVANTLEFDTTNECDFTPFLGRWLRVRVYADAFSLAAAPSERTLYETFLDGYKDGYGLTAGFKVATRATYADMPGTISSLESVFALTAVSRTFGAAERRLVYDATRRTVMLGSRVAVVPYTSDRGTSVAMPSATPQGYRFTLYDGNGVDYFEFEVVGSLPGSNDGYLNITSHPRISEERFLQLATVLSNPVSFTHFKDTRQFGNVGRQDVRDDFTRDYVSYPRSLLRGNGVIYGFVASGKSTDTLTVTGGQALVNGQLKSVGKTTFAIPTDGAVTYNLFVDTDGVLCLRRNDEFVPGFISTPGIGELLAGRTETALAQVMVNVSNVITDIIDLRRFVNDIDSKLDLLVEENDITHGSFASLKAAIDYLDSLPTSGDSSNASSRRIRVRGEVLLSEPVYLPWNTVLEGDGYGISGTANRSARITYTTSDACIQTMSGNTIRNLAFFRSKGLPTGFIYTPDPVTYLTVENCVFEFGTSDDTNIAILIEAGASYAAIRRNVFRKVGTAVRVEGSASYCNIDDNVVSEMRVNGVFLGGSYSTSVSRNRMITTSITTAGGTAFIRLGSGSGSVYFTKVADNLLIHNSTQATAVSNTHMIDVSGASVTVASLVIERNFLENAYAGYGFAKGIVCTSPTMSDLVVRENVLYYLSTTAVGQGIYVDNGPRSTIANNRLIQCVQSLWVTNSDGAIVAENIIYDDKSSSVETALSIDSSSGFSVVGNHVSHSGTGSVCWLCFINSGCEKGIVCNNVFEAMGASSDKPLLIVQGDDTIFSGNKFIGNTFSSGFYSPMLVSGGDDNLIVGNSFSITSVAASACITFSGGTGNVEVLNKGQTYQICVPISNAESTHDNFGNSGWSYYGLNWQIDNGDWDGFFDILCISFGEDFVPVGATISKVEVYYGLSGGDTSKLTFYWCRVRYGNTFATVVPTTNAGYADGVYHTQTLTPSSISPLVMERGDLQHIEIRAPDGTGVWNAAVVDVRVTYVL